MGQQINNQGILVTDPAKGTKTYYYRSKYPPRLLKGDVFLSDSGVMIEVIHHNEFHLKITKSSDKYDVFQSNDGVFFRDVKNNEMTQNNAMVITHGPVGEDLTEIYGQAIQLQDNINYKNYIFYFSENKNDELLNINSAIDIFTTPISTTPFITTTTTATPSITTTTATPIENETQTENDTSVENFENYSNNNLDEIPYIIINQYKVYPSLKPKDKSYQSAQKELPFIDYKNYNHLIS